MRSLRGQLLASHLLLLGLMLLLLSGGVARFFHLGSSVDRVLDANVKSVLLMQRAKDALAELERSGGRDAMAARQVAEAIEQELGNITEPGELAMAEELRDTFAAYRKDSVPRRALDEKAQAILELNLAAMRAADQRAKAEARQSALLGLGATVLAAVVAIGLALRSIRVALLPMVSLARQAEAIGAGSLNQRIEVQRDDEIGSLARAFNGMSEKLSEARAALEARLTRAERTSDAALESLYDPVLVTDADGKIVHLNRAGVDLLGARLGAPPGEARIAQAVDTALREGRTVAADDESARVSLRGRVYRLRVSPMADARGQRFGAVAVLEDVTYLQEVDRLKTEFIGVASHELRTPVTSLLLSVQLLEEGALGPLPEPVAEVVAVQREDLLRLERLLRDLLDLSKLEAGASEPRPEAIPADTLIGAALDGVRAEAASRQIALETGAPCPARVRADRVQIGRVLTNLLGNALRHTPEGGRVTLTAEEEGEDRVRFTVTDTGSGIPAGFQDAIFERFTQVPGATRGGAGLGLSIARALVEAHGGTIEARSDGPGAGSAFTFTLPTAKG